MQRHSNVCDSSKSWQREHVSTEGVTDDGDSSSRDSSSTSIITKTTVLHRVTDRYGHPQVADRLVYSAPRRVMQGHFQIMFNPKVCPLFQSKLSWGMRILYSSGVWSYVCAAISTPTFIVIPLVSPHPYPRT